MKSFKDILQETVGITETAQDFNSVAKRNGIPIEKFNPHHDEKGRFAPKDGSGGNKPVYLHATKAQFDKFKPAGDGFVYFSLKEGDKKTYSDVLYNTNETTHPKAPKYRMITSSIDESKLKTFNPFKDDEAKKIAEKHGLPTDRTYVKWDDLPIISADIRAAGYSKVEVLEPSGQYTVAISNMDAIKIESVKEWDPDETKKSKTGAAAQLFNDVIAKYNPHHDERGRFATRDGSKLHVPDKSKDYAHIKPEHIESGSSYEMHFNAKKGRISAARRKLYEEIISKHIDHVEPSDDPTLFYMGGGGGSGKSYLIKSGIAPVPSQASGKAVHVNPDDIKAMFPEYNQLRFDKDPEKARTAASFVHDESSIVADEIARRAIAKGCSVVIDGTGYNVDRVKGQIQMTASKGYKVHGHYVNTPFETALANNQKRFNDPNERRYVPEEILKHAHVQVAKNFDKITELFDEMSLYYNDGKTTPIKIASKQQSDILRVQDEEKYKEFLKKGEM